MEIMEDSPRLFETNARELKKRNYKRINNPRKPMNSKGKAVVNKQWKSSFHNARTRCTNPKHIQYKNYGGRGIKFLLTLPEIEFIWERDRAHLLKRPSIDRINNDGNYEFSNCRFIELSNNVSKSLKGCGGWLKHKKCKECGTNKNPYEGVGLCKLCYQNRWNRIGRRRIVAPDKSKSLRKQIPCSTCGVTIQPLVDKHVFCSRSCAMVARHKRNKK